MKRLRFDGHYVLAKINDSWETVSLEWDRELKHKLQHVSVDAKVNERTVVLFAREAMLNYIEECLNAVGQEPFTRDERKFVERCLVQIIN